MTGFAELVETESRGLVAAATAIVGDVHRAEEIVQTAFERCFRRWSRVSRLDRPGAWVRRVVINEAIEDFGIGFEISADDHQIAELDRHRLEDCR